MSPLYHSNVTSANATRTTSKQQYNIGVAILFTCVLVHDVY